MWECNHLWLYVLGLGFSRRAAENKGVSVGRNTFSKPNQGAFGFFIQFLFAKLDAARTKKTLGKFSFLGKSIASLEFRKQCSKWLKEIIASEDKGCVFQIAPSSLLSPVGPKINYVLYRLARHVMIKDLKKNDGTEPVKSKNVYLANARCRVAYNKLLQFFQKEAFVIHEYKKKVKLLVKEIEQMQSANAAMGIQSCKRKHNDQKRNDKMERIQKVCSMWTLIMEVLTSLKKQREIVDSILDVPEDSVGQCILNGTKVFFSVPQQVACQVERGIHEVCKENVYEGEKMNFLAVIQLVNEALRTLRDERCQSELIQQIQGIKSMVTDHKKILQDLKAKRLKIEQEHCVSISESISEKQKAWEVKWKKFFVLHPLTLTLQQDSELDFRGLLLHSFNLTEDDDKGSFFYQRLLSVSDDHSSVHGVRYEEDGGALETVVDKLPSPPNWLSSVPLELSKASENKGVLIEKNLSAETCKGKKKHVPPKVLRNEKDKSTISEVWENVGDHVIQTEASVKKEDRVEKARDELAEEVLKAVMAQSPQGEEGTGMPLDDLISSLAFNPFLTRKEILRTPENTVPKIRSLWRKAVKTEGSSDVKLDPTEIMTEEAPMDARPIMQKAADSRFQCSTSASPVPDSYLPLSEFKSQLNSAEFRLQEQMRISHISESPVLETSEMQESEITEEQGTSVEDPEEQNFQYIKSMNTLDISSDNNNRINTLPSDHVWDSLSDKMLHCYASPCGILGETLPEELSYINSNKSANSESDFDVIGSAYVTHDSKNKEDIKKLKLDIQSLFNTHKALEKTASRSEEELHQMHNGGESVSCRSDLNLAQEKRDEFYSPLKFFCLDEEFTKMPSSASPNERKHSLSSLLISCQQLEEMASMIQEMPLDLIHKLKDKERLSEELDTKEPSSG